MHFCQVPQNHALFWLLFAYFASMPVSTISAKKKSRTTFSRWRFSLFGTIVWLTIDWLRHFVHWHWSWHWLFLVSLSRHTIFLWHTCDTPVSCDKPPIPLRHTEKLCFIWFEKPNFSISSTPKIFIVFTLAMYFKGGDKRCYSWGAWIVSQQTYWSWDWDCDWEPKH